ncbi:hypothetical protein BH23ACT2_BH23ACT2_06510 [soil metagenome]
MDGTVRTAALIRRQLPDVQQRIRRAFDTLASAAATPHGIEIPISVRLAVARR